MPISWFLNFPRYLQVDRSDKSHPLLDINRGILGVNALISSALAKKKKKKKKWLKIKTKIKIP